VHQLLRLGVRVADSGPVSMRYVHIGTRIYLGEPDSSQRIFVVKDVELGPKQKADTAELAQKMQSMGIKENGHAGKAVFDVDWKTVVARKVGRRRRKTGESPSMNRSAVLSA
jgi:hypothetical protein